MQEAFCPECGHRLKIGTEPYQGQEIMCHTCQTVLEVVNLTPLELDVSLTAEYKSKRQHKSEAQERIGKKHNVIWR